MQLFIALVAIVSAAVAEPRLQAPDAGVTAGAAVVLTFRPQSGVPVWVDGCSAVELERREGEAWVPLADAAPCDGAAAARSVTKELVLTLASPSPGTYRGVVAWGAACREGRPFAIAGCGTRGVARSAEFAVAAAPGPAQR